ncbi:hypothetical protein NECHADRAFT_43411 [Paecilomyces variotii No. 5]|uniref:aldehyde dehydrogenase (NAD(+)) n=1 Tax=Byssochlamys spectabilis (strain No. 5 / NBRC 109023) TaxID=1356009 RepID=V5I2L7_BYSSN|nr:hypothetical protein NECHADRAFT_43411 [Paecilomyces variotii No. 5]
MASINFSTFSNIINGETRSSSQVGHGINPSTKKPLWDVPVATEHDVNEAVAAAKKAYPAWSRTPWSERAKLLTRAKDALLERKDEMAHLIMQEGGKPIQFGALEVEHAVGFLNFHSTHPELETKVVHDDDDLKMTLRHVPIGVVAAICPWNYPLVLAMGKIGAALITGNCVITKPSPFTPYSILKFTEMVKDIFPPGVIQVLNGNDKTGPELCDHPDVDKISFTGSIATGKRIMASAAKTLKRVTLELGGNNASIICPDVDIPYVASQVALGSFFNSGQLCVASKRLYVHEDIYQEFLNALADVVKSWKVGSSTPEAGNMLGPVQNEMQYNIVKQFFLDAHNNGYKFALGSGDVKDGDGFVINPAIIDNPPDHSKIVTEEPFGPIVPVLSWKTEEEVIQRANDTNTGLGGAVWSSDLDRANRVADQIEAGTIWINSFEKPHPLGYLAGHKESGLGGEWGTAGLLSYCNTKVIHYYKNSVAPGKAGK